MDTSRRIPKIREDVFPDLFASGYCKTSEEDLYNCIAWAAGPEHIDECWNPFCIGQGYYWPDDLERNSELATFVKLYERHGGYIVCDSEQFEPGFEKIALYVDDQKEVTHAARQLEDGTWTSKLGDWEDINHSTLAGLSGKIYGKPAKFLKRSRRRLSSC